MKLTYLLLGLMLTTLNTQAQFTFKDTDGNIYEDGAVYTTNTTVYENSAIDYIIENDAPNDIFLKAELVSATGDPADFEICFGLCYTGVSVGQKFPNNGSIPVAQGGDSGTGNHMYNAGENGDDILDYVFRFYQTSEDGTTELGQEMTITYRFDPNALGVNDVKDLGVILQSTMITDRLSISSVNDLSLTIYDLQGRVVANHEINAGSQVVNVSNLRSQMYILQFNNAEGASFTSKVIVK